MPQFGECGLGMEPIHTAISQFCLTDQSYAPNEKQTPPPLFNHLLHIIHTRNKKHLHFAMISILFFPHTQIRNPFLTLLITVIQTPTQELLVLSYIKAIMQVHGENFIQQNNTCACWSTSSTRPIQIGSSAIGSHQRLCSALDLESDLQLHSCLESTTMQKPMPEGYMAGKAHRGQVWHSQYQAMERLIHIAKGAALQQKS